MKSRQVVNRAVNACRGHLAFQGKFDDVEKLIMTRACVKKVGTEVPSNPIDDLVDSVREILEVNNLIAQRASKNGMISRWWTLA